MNTLDKKRKHTRRYIWTDKTTAFILEELSKKWDFRLKYKIAKKQSKGLRDKIIYDMIIVYIWSEAGSYKLKNQQEVDYFIDMSNKHNQPVNLWSYERQKQQRNNEEMVLSFNYL